MSSSRWITSIAVCLLLLQVGLTGPIAELSNFDQSLGAGSAPQANDESTSQNGNGSIKTSYWVGQQSTSGIHDSYLAAASPNSNFGSSEELKIGFSTNASQRWNSVIGFSGYPPNLPSNVTIQSASLALNIKQMSGQPTIRSWMGYSNWDASTTTWNSWNSGGALGNQDSGGLMDEVTITNQSGWVELDITRSIQAGYEQFRLTGSTSPTVVLTGDAWGEDWSIFHSSDYVFESERPRINITYSWGITPLSNSISWVDISPKPPHKIDADTQLTLSALGRDAVGQVVTGTVQWSSSTGSIDSGGLFTPDLSGRTDINGTISNVIGTLNLTVTNGMPVSLDLETKIVDITIDDTFQFNSTFVDSHGNSVTEAALTWYSDNGIVNETGFYTPTTVGSDQLTVVWQSLSASADINIGAGVATNISFGENFTVASGEQVPLLFTVTDRLGNILDPTAAGGINWQAENGNIDGVGVYTGDQVGLWRVNATSTSGAIGHTYVDVTPGSLSSIELVAPNGSQPADEAILLVVNWLDTRGNVVPVRIPLSNWTADEGNFRMTPGGVEWIPRREGNWTVGVHVEDQFSNITISVVHGMVDRILISTDSESISADDEAELSLFAEDSRGNRWSVGGTWTPMEPEASPWLSPSGNGATFTGQKVGNWTIRAEYSQENVTFTTYLTFEVSPGSLALIELRGDGDMLSADSYHDFSPLFFDENGNELPEIQMNWSFTHDGTTNDKTGEIRGNDGIWYPVSAGHHEIEVEAAGVFASLGIDVSPGIAHSLRTLQTNGVVVESGNITTVQINATDLDGNDFGIDVDWSVPYQSVELANGTRAGEYLLRGLRYGSHTLDFHSGLADGSITVTVLYGEVISLQINIADQEVHAGDVIDAQIIAYDYGGNEVPINADEISLYSIAGTFGHSTGNFWKFAVAKSGSQLKIEASYHNANGETYLDVKSNALGAFGESALSTTLWTGIATVVLMFTLLIFMLRRKSKTEQDALDHHFGVDSPMQQKNASHADKMAGYRPSKKARSAARQAFMQKQQQLGHAQWGAYQYAQQPGMGLQPNQTQQPTFGSAHENPVQQTGQTTQPANEGEQTGEAWTNSTSTTDATSTSEEAPWTTEQVWAWGRSRGMTDEQIYEWEATYDATVRNPPQSGNSTPSITDGGINYHAANQESQSEETVQYIETGNQNIAQTPTLEPPPTPLDVTQTTPPITTPEVEQDPPSASENRETKHVDVRAKGIMKAMPGTTQGEAGWYLDGEGSTSRWDIDEDGTWHRTG